MGSKGKDSRVKLKHCISFPQYLLSAPRNNTKTNKQKKPDIMMASTEI